VLSFADLLRELFTFRDQNCSGFARARRAVWAVPTRSSAPPQAAHSRSSAPISRPGVKA